MAAEREALVLVTEPVRYLGHRQALPPGAASLPGAEYAEAGVPPGQ